MRDYLNYKYLLKVITNNIKEIHLKNINNLNNNDNNNNSNNAKDIKLQIFNTDLKKIGTKEPLYFVIDVTDGKQFGNDKNKKQQLKYNIIYDMDININNLFMPENELILKYNLNKNDLKEQPYNYKIKSFIFNINNKIEGNKILNDIQQQINNAYAFNKKKGLFINGIKINLIHDTHNQYKRFKSIFNENKIQNMFNNFDNDNDKHKTYINQCLLYLLNNNIIENNSNIFFFKATRNRKNRNDDNDKRLYEPIEIMYKKQFDIYYPLILKKITNPNKKLLFIITAIKQYNNDNDNILHLITKYDFKINIYQYFIQQIKYLNCDYMFNEKDLSGNTPIFYLLTKERYNSDINNLNN